MKGATPYVWSWNAQQLETPALRLLHPTVEVDEEIPPEHYKAVEVIGYVMRLRRAGCAVSRHEMSTCRQERLAAAANRDSLQRLIREADRALLRLGRPRLLSGTLASHHPPQR